MTPDTRHGLERGTELARRNNDLLLAITFEQRQWLPWFLTPWEHVEIAARMGVSKHTVSDAARRLRRRLGVRSRLELILLFAEPLTPAAGG